MRREGQESEAKFLVSDLQGLETRLSASGALVIQPRTHEVNYRFDMPDRSLTRGGRVLRLRKDTAVHLTYKDVGRRESGVLSRRELEFDVSDFETARDLLLALGYEIAFIYEKRRTTLSASSVEFMLDELPYGEFIEIEGPAGAIKPAALKIGLRWEAAISRSYHELFVELQAKKNLGFRDLTFEAFSGISVSPADLGAELADQPPRHGGS